MEDKKIVRFLFCIFVLLMIVQFVEAKSGCCSHHGGVCGNKCCDGTALSSACGDNGSSSSSSSITTSSSSSNSNTNYTNQTTPARTCNETSQIYCSGKSLYTLKILSNCFSTTTSINCDYKCENGACIKQTCPEGYTGMPYCLASSLYQNYTYQNCTNGNKIIQTCNHKCENGACIKQSSSLNGFYIGTFVLIVIVLSYFFLRKKHNIYPEKDYSKKQETKQELKEQELTLKRKEGDIQKINFVCPACNKKLSQIIDINKKIDFETKCSDCGKVISIKRK